MKLYSLILTLLLSSNLFAQTLTENQEQIIRNLMVQYYGDGVKSEPLNTGFNSFVFIKSDTFYSPDGFHYLFKLTKDTALRLDKTFYHGGNFRRFLFTRGNLVFHLGGYGLYNTNNNLEVFDLSINKWRLEKTAGQKPPYINGIVLEKGDLIYSLYNYKSGNNIDQDEFDNNIYKLDLSTNTWTKYSNINLPNDRPVRAYYTPNFALVIRYNEAMLIDKTNFKYIILGRDAFYSSHNEYQFETNGDSIKFGTSNKFINLKDLWSKYAHNTKDFILEPNWFQLLFEHIYLALSALLLFFYLSVYFIRKKKLKSTPYNKPDNEVYLNPIVEKIRLAPKTTLDIDALDALLEINHMEFDSRKLKRHRLLSDLEKTNPGLITRQKDETDKRRFIYIIQKTEQK